MKASAFCPISPSQNSDLTLYYWHVSWTLHLRTLQLQHPQNHTNRKIFQQSSLKTRENFSVPNAYFWNKMLSLEALNAFLNSSSPKCCMATDIELHLTRSILSGSYQNSQLSYPLSVSLFFEVLQVLLCE